MSWFWDAESRCMSSDEGWAATRMAEQLSSLSRMFGRWWPLNPLPEAGALQSDKHLHSSRSHCLTEMSVDKSFLICELREHVLMWRNS